MVDIFRSRFQISHTIVLYDRLRTVFFQWVRDTVLDPGISPLKHAKKCVFGVFLNHTRIALVCKN